jgi:hypothetical protein
MVLNFVSGYGSLENLRKDLDGQFNDYNKQRGYKRECWQRKSAT